MKKLKICMFIRLLPHHSTGGMQDIAWFTACALTNLGHKIHIITTSHPEYKKLYDNNIQIYFIENTVSQKYSSQWWKRSAESFIELNNKENFDIVFSTSIAAYSLFKNRYLQKNNIASLIVMHGIFWDAVISQLYLGISFSSFIKDLLRIPYYILQNLFYSYPKEFISNNRASMAVATSNEQYELMKRFYFLNEKKITKIFNAINTEIYKPRSINNNLKLELFQNTDCKILLCAARLGKEKGIQFAIKALKKLIHHNNNIRMLVIGEGQYKSQLIDLTTKLNLTNYVKFIGFVDSEKFAEYLNICDIFINPTIRKDGYDLTIIEAMACEKVVICSEVGSVKTVIDNNKNGILFKMKDINELSESVLKCLNNKDYADTIAKNGRKTVENYFNTDLMANKYENLFYKLLNKK